MREIEYRVSDDEYRDLCRGSGSDGQWESCERFDYKTGKWNDDDVAWDVMEGQIPSYRITAKEARQMTQEKEPVQASKGKISKATNKSGKRIPPFVPAIIAVVAVVLVIIAIGSSGSGDVSTNSSSQVDSDTAQADSTSTGSSEDISTETSDAQASNRKATTEAALIAVGDTVSIEDVCDFTVDYINITNDVMPPQPASYYYNHIQAEDGKVYVDLCIAYTNKKSSKVGADEVMHGTLLYAGKYEYTGYTSIEEDNRSSFTYANISSIAPLSTEYLHYLFKVPEEVESSSGAIELEMIIGGENYRVVVREGTGESSTTEMAASSGNTKTSGEVTIGETVVTDNAEFSVDYSDITSKVMPPQPTGYYTYYEADDGEVYVDVCWAFKNTSGNSVMADEVIDAELKYADQYEYSGFSTIEEDNRSNLTYANITKIAPLSTEYVHYLFKVPEDVETSSDSVVVTFKVDGNTYTYTVR